MSYYKQPWRGAPQPVTMADTLFMRNLLAGVRRVREQAAAHHGSRPNGKTPQNANTEARADHDHK